MRLTLNSSVKVKQPEEIMVGYLAASVVENDCWKEEIAYVIDGCNQGAFTSDGTPNPLFYKQAKKQLEEQFKAKNGLTQMPGKYRSAKSVICKALKYNVDLLDEDGLPRGKSEVEKHVREAATTIKGVLVNRPPMTTTKVVLKGDEAPYVRAFWCAKEIEDLWPALSNVERDIILNIFKKLPIKGLSK